MKQKILLIYNEVDNDDKIFISIKSELFSQLISYLPFAEKDFEIEDLQKKLDFFEAVILLLNRDLDRRINPELPQHLYLPEEQMYRHITLYGVDYKFLQGHEKDGKILTLLELKEFINKSIRASNKIRGKFISRKSEAYHPA